MFVFVFYVVFSYRNYNGDGVFCFVDYRGLLFSWDRGDINVVLGFSGLNGF